jgi:anti-anti-sigma factor
MSAFTPEGVEASVESVDRPGTVVLRLAGDLATSTEVRLREAYAQAAAGGASEVVADFAAVEHINSSGISVLIDLLRESQEGGRRLAFSGLTPHYAKVFTFMGLTQYAPIVEQPAKLASDGAAAQAEAESN